MKKGYESAQEAKPSPRQLRWQETEFYALISYGLPVFTGRQYGDGHTPASMFWPEDMNTDSWCETAKNAGMDCISVSWGFRPEQTLREAGAAAIAPDVDALLALLE